MKKRRFGRTNLEVSIIGCGGMFIASQASYFPPEFTPLKFDQAIEVVRRAFELGINYFDTSPGYGDSEERLGAALEDVRDECVLATKIDPIKGNMSSIESSLRNLKTDRLDLIQMPINDSRVLKKVMGSDSALEICKEARSKSLVDFIGITGHCPNVLVEAIKTGEFDSVLVPFNVTTRQALETLIPLAKELEIGIAVMKPLATKISNIVTWVYKGPLALFSEVSDLKAFLGKDKNARVRSSIRYVLAHDVSTSVVGFGAVDQVEWAVKVAEEFKGLTADEEKRFNVPLGDKYCRDCGLCLPCPEKVNIAAVLRFLSLSKDFGLKKWARMLYKALPTYQQMATAEACTECGECEPKCPFGLPIIEMIKQAKKVLSRG